MLTVHKDSMVAVSKLFYFHAPDNPHGALTPLLIFIEHLSSPPELVHNFMLTFSEVYEWHAAYGGVRFRRTMSACAGQGQGHPCGIEAAQQNSAHARVSPDADS